MATFHYQGSDRSGKSVRGMIAAETIRAARDRLREGGVFVRAIQARESSRRSEAVHIFRSRYTAALTEFLRELTTLLQAAIPLLDAMDSCIPQAKPALQSALFALRDRVAGGESLADAMGHEKWLFDQMMVGMVRVGEHAGNLEEVLDQIATFREQSSQLRDRVVSALLYPAIVLTVSMGVTVFLMTVVVPMLLQNLSELGRQLPLPTRILKTMSDGLLNHGWWLSLAIGACVIAVLMWMRTPTGKWQTSTMLLRLPLIGQLARKQAIGRIALVLACLIRSGVELVDALVIAENACSNIVFRQALHQIRNDLEMGRGLRESVQKQSVFPPTVAQIFAVGQQSGQLDSMLVRLGQDYDRQSSVLASRITSVAEPLLILILSVIVGFILFATVLPILEAGNVLTS